MPFRLLNCQCLLQSTEFLIHQHLTGRIIDVATTIVDSATKAYFTAGKCPTAVDAAYCQPIVEAACCRECTLMNAFSYPCHSFASLFVFDICFL